MSSVAKIPAEMRCVEIKTPGGPEVLVAATRPVPVPKAGEVLIAVRAAGVNRPDIMQRIGMYPPPPGAPDLPGLEVSGIVVAHGEGVAAPAIGTGVCALIAGGGYAEYATAPASSCLPIPEGIDFEGAAGLPETFFTVWHNVFERGALKAGEVFLVHGGTSGIGTTAIQMARAFGARVIATAGSDEKCEACKELGADMAVNYRTQDFAAVIKESPFKGVDVILDMVAGDYTPRNLSCLKPDGRLVLIALLNGPKTSIDLVPFLLKRVHLTGSTLRARDNAFKGALADALKVKVWPMLAAGLVRPIIDKTYPLAEAAEAHRRMEASLHVGKIILTVDKKN
jgi:NADPH2:quinone reductase